MSYRKQFYNSCLFAFTVKAHSVGCGGFLPVEWVSQCSIDSKCLANRRAWILNSGIAIASQYLALSMGPT